MKNILSKTPHGLPLRRALVIDFGDGSIQMRLEARKRSRRSQVCAWCSRRIADRWLFRGCGRALHRTCACSVALRFQRIWRAGEIECSFERFDRLHAYSLRDAEPSRERRELAARFGAPDVEPEIIKF